MNRLGSRRVRRRLGGSPTDAQWLKQWHIELATIHGRALTILYSKRHITEDTASKYQTRYKHAAESLQIMERSDRAFNAAEKFMIDLELWLLHRRADRLGRS